jgi:archaellum component FlaC
MDKDFSELIEYLDGKFQKIDDRFERIDGQFVEVSRQFGEVNNKLEILEENKSDKSDVNDLTTAIDAYAKRADTYFQEMVMLAHKVDRHEKWMHQLADKLGVKLEY